MLYSSVLVANRGEIAVRIIRACQRLGLRAIAVFSDADRGALHVRLADSAIHIGPAEARASYLDGERIIAAAVQAGAEALHPGYGFLAENAAFARACQAAGLVFIGPAPETIAAMGAKIEAKRIAARAGVPCVPGYHGDDQSDACLMREAARIGAPLLIKASAGGGGRGMRRVDDPGCLASDLALARREAAAAFGDATLLLERYIQSPRHIEVQILGDKHGNVRHLYERDCSVQRNYQKIVEEAPAPNLDPALRRRVLEAAVALARAIAYDNAGTVEFVVDADTREAYFLEVNTRLQVEHPVTEMITGFDLVEWQLRIAGGEMLDFSQDAVPCRGWAIEARIAAEDPAQGYRAQTGVITAYDEPELPGLRIDSGVARGSVVSPYYDSMLAKVIAHGQDRPAALNILRRGLAAYRIGGVGTNAGFLGDVLELPDFRAGTHLTDCLARGFAQGWSPAPVTATALALAVLARHLSLEQAGPATPWSKLGGWRLGERCGRPGAATYLVNWGETVHDPVVVHGRGGQYRIEHGGETVLATTQAALEDGCLHYGDAGEVARVAISMDGAQVTLHDGSKRFEFAVLCAEDALLAPLDEAAGAGDAVVAPTPGLIADVLVSPGDRVRAGQPVIVLEAMKLLQHLCAPVAAVVRHIRCRPGDAVDGGACLITFEPADDGPGSQETDDDRQEHILHR